jgi:hypothetical protein
MIPSPGGPNSAASRTSGRREAPLAESRKRFTVCVVESRLTLEAVEAMVTERRRTADSKRLLLRESEERQPAPRRDDEQTAVTVRLASGEDGRALHRLAQLDSAAPPAGPTLVAEVDGELVAAVPLGGGTPVADPFRHTAELVRLLKLRVAQLNGDGRRSRLRPRRVFGYGLPPFRRQRTAR